MSRAQMSQKRASFPTYRYEEHGNILGLPSTVRLEGQTLVLQASTDPAVARCPIQALRPRDYSRPRLIASSILSGFNLAT